MLYFGNPAYLSLADRQLMIKLPQVEKNQVLPDQLKEGMQHFATIEDIGIIILDHPQITITHALMMALHAANVLIISCGSTHHPEALMLPLAGHTLQSERFRHQIEASEPLKKNIWAQCISAKIKNQQSLLSTLGINASYLEPLYKNMRSGDPKNHEATAALFYWQKIFETVAPGFIRYREGPPPNNMLNYGYAILRATMARSIVAAGLLPTLGIFHRNRYNAFCLADDLMEPYRPFVDKVVYDLIEQEGVPKDISPPIKKQLLSIPTLDVWMNGEQRPLMVATQRTATSLVKCFAGTQRKLLCPELSALL